MPFLVAPHSNKPFISNVMYLMNPLISGMFIVQRTKLWSAWNLIPRVVGFTFVFPSARQRNNSYLCLFFALFLYLHLFIITCQWLSFEGSVASFICVVRRGELRSPMSSARWLIPRLLTIGSPRGDEGVSHLSRIFRNLQVSLWGTRGYKVCSNYFFVVRRSYFRFDNFISQRLWKNNNRMTPLSVSAHPLNRCQ